MIGTRISSTGTRPMAIIGLLAGVGASIVIGALAASFFAGPQPRGGDFGVVAPAARPSASTTSAPITSTPSAAPTASAPLRPSVDPAGSEVPGRDAIPLTVDLVNETGDKVHVDIADRSGLLVDAVSGTPGGGASVEPYKLRIENIDSRTLRLTWSDYAIPNTLALYIDETAGRFLLVQPEPTSGVDTMVHDRVLILTFSEPISADDVEAILQDGLDT